MKTQTRKSECREQVKTYLQEHSPYEKIPSLGYNIAEMSKYARNRNISISEMTAQEAEMFLVKHTGSL